MLEADGRARRTLGASFAEFLRAETAGAVILLAATVVAFVAANSPLHEEFARMFETSATFRAAGDVVHLSPKGVIDDALMALFFFVVGLEIKRELVTGELSQRRSALLPALAALGGMVVPALIYLAVAGQGPTARGWGIPVATDIAFALGVLALLGRRVPVGLKVFLVALAIVDDIGAIVVIALFYSAPVLWIALLAAALLLAMLVALNRQGVKHPAAYAVVGLGVWAAVLASGVHPTIAGVLVALTIPTETLLPRFESALHPLTTFIVLPLFALANAGVRIAGADAASLALAPVSLGVALGLVVGKPVGICAAAWLACRARLSELPAGTSWPQFGGAAVLGGIGFTMSLFVANLAFTDSALLMDAKLAILIASTIAGVVGYVWIRATSPAETPGTFASDIEGNAMSGHKFDLAKLDRLNDPGRFETLRPEVMWDALGRPDAHTIVEIGAGTGLFSAKFAELAPHATVFAADIEPEMLQWMRDNREEVATGRMVVLPSEERRVPLDDGVADLVVMVNLHHELDDPAAIYTEALRLLAAGGQVLVVDWLDAETPKGPPLAVRASADELAHALTDAGFKDVQPHEGLPWHSLVTGRKAS